MVNINRMSTPENVFIKICPWDIAEIARIGWFFQICMILADFENLVPSSETCWTLRLEFNGLFSAHGQGEETYRENPPLKCVCRLEIEAIFAK